MTCSSASRSSASPTRPTGACTCSRSPRRVTGCGDRGRRRSGPARRRSSPPCRPAIARRSFGHLSPYSSATGRRRHEKLSGVRIGLQIPDFTTPDGPPRLGADLATVARTADEGGFEFIAVMDHFFQIRGVGPAEREMLEAYTTLGYLAACTSRAKLLTLVTGAVYRHPGVLAKIVTTLDVLSGGRAWLGIGAAWNEEESRGLGIPFPPVAERFERLAESPHIRLQMWRGGESPYPGRHHHPDPPLNSPQAPTQP